MAEAVDAIAPILQRIQADQAEFREEMREFRTDTRVNFQGLFHVASVHEARLNDMGEQLKEINAHLGSLEMQMAGLLSTIPPMRSRLDALEARIAALESTKP